MSDNLTGKVKEFILFAPRGALSLIRDTAPSVISILVSRGKLDDAQSAAHNSPETIASENDRTLVKKRMDTYTSDIQKSKNAMFSALGAFDMFKKNLPTIQAVTNSKGKVIAQQNVAATKKSIFSKIGDKLKNPVIEPEVEVIEVPDENVIHAMVKGGVDVVQTAVGKSVGIAQSCLSTASGLIHGTQNIEHAAHEGDGKGENTNNK